eukprot:gene10076-13542_t
MSYNHNQFSQHLVTGLTCPKCSRDYVLPHKYLVRPEDYDFQPIPRLLPCLHTVCHSCIEDQYQRNSIEKLLPTVTCHICKHSEIIKGVKYLPFDVLTLLELVQVKNTDILSYCVKCYEKVPSVSYCESCSSSLCEFHHQDHILSILTNSHVIKTKYEHKYSNKEKLVLGKLSNHNNQHNKSTIPPPLPPTNTNINNNFINIKLNKIPCPECLLVDCSLYCNTCLYLISPQAMIDYHKNHEVVNYKSIIPEMKKTIIESNKLSNTINQKLKGCINHINNQLNEISANEENCLSTIANVFNQLHNELKERENTLLERLNAVVEEKKQALYSELEQIKHLYYSNSTASFISKGVMNIGTPLSEFDDKGNYNILDYDNNNHNNQKSSHFIEESEETIEDMYIISCAEAIEDRVDNLSEMASLKTNSLNLPDINLDINFIQQEIDRISGMISSLGGFRHSTTTIPFQNNNNNDDYDGNYSNDDYDDNNNKAQPKIYFNLVLR